MDKGGQEYASNAGRWGEKEGGGQTKWKASSEAFAGKSDKWDGRSRSHTPPHRTPRLPRPGLPEAGVLQIPEEDGEEEGKQAGEPRCWRNEVTLKLLEKNPKMICGFEGRETSVRAAAGAGGGTGTCGGEVRTAAGSPGRRLSGAASLRFRGGGASRPHGRT